MKRRWLFAPNTRNVNFKTCLQKKTCFAGSVIQMKSQKSIFWKWQASIPKSRQEDECTLLLGTYVELVDKEAVLKQKGLLVNTVIGVLQTKTVSARSRAVPQAHITLAWCCTVHSPPLPGGSITSCVVGWPGEGASEEKRRKKSSSEELTMFLCCKTSNVMTSSMVEETMWRILERDEAWFSASFFSSINYFIYLIQSSRFCCLKKVSCPTGSLRWSTRGAAWPSWSGW